MFTIKKIRKGKSSGYKKRRLNLLKYTGITAGTLLLMTVVYFGEQTGQWFKASVLDLPQPFSGTVPPLGKVPNWTTWKGDHYKTTYSQISPSDLMDLPFYDTQKMRFPNEDLVWGNAQHDDIRNTKITYSVVYLGNYTLDHVEYSGSHPAVDIKTPLDSPVYAIANGKVVKASTQSSGFGHHIVIKHINVPDPENPSKTTTLYSSYSHMNQVNVSEGQNVTKGQQIGTSGNTGTSTTPHLHFQIDRESAPWHPYWPFSSTDAANAGLSFFEAINSALGLDNAKNHTVNPMAFIYGHLNDSFVVSSGNTSTPTTNDPGVDIVDNPFEETPTPSPTPTPEPTPTPTSNPGVDPNLFTFNLRGESVALLNNGVPVTVTISQADYNNWPTGTQLRAEVSGVGTAVKKLLDKSDFVNLSATLVARSSEPGKGSISVGRSTHAITYVEQVTSIASFGVTHDGAFQKGVEEIITIEARDLSGKATPAAVFSGIVDVSLKEGQANIVPRRLLSSDFKDGKATLRMTATTEDRIVVRVQQGALVGESDTMTAESKSAFADINMGHKNYQAIKYLKEQNIINGYSDGTFRPNQTVNRVEALKMLMLAFNVEVIAGNPLPFTDTLNNAWYSSTLSAALNKRIVQGYPDGSFKPSDTVNRAELLKMLLLTADENTTVTMNADPYSDVPVGTWFAQYAYLAKKKNLVEDENAFRPADGMTRAEVAEAIYRMRTIKDNHLVTYSK